MKLQKSENDQRKQLQLLFLIAAAATIFPILIVNSFFPGYGSYLREQFVVVPCLLFFGSALTQRLSRSARRTVLLSVLMVLWFMVVQTNHWMNSMGNRNFGIFATAYLLALPYATVTEERKSTGLSWVGGMYVAYSLTVTALCGMLLADKVPAILTDLVRWEGTRLSVFAHPNGVGFVLLLGIGFSLYFLMTANKKWIKYVLGVLAALQFLAQILTNSRTAIMLTCALFAGVLFFVLWNGTWKRFLSGALMAAVLIVALFSLSGKVYDLHVDAQITKLLNQTEAEAAEGRTGQQLHINEATGEITVTGTMVSTQGDLTSDMKTLNGRTWIWWAVFSTLHDNPDIKIWGTEYVSSEISYRLPFSVVNAHNSWFQTLMEMGVIGFLLAVLYTVVAVWNLWKVMWRMGESLSRKIIAMVMICILGGSILESYLFVGGMNFVNFLFFLCLGYLIQWNGEFSAEA